jgi:hypothetical protein
MGPLRRIEKQAGDDWEQCRMQDLEVGDICRMWTDDEDESTGFDMTVESEPRLDPENNVWGISAKLHDDV